MTKMSEHAAQSPDPIDALIARPSGAVLAVLVATNGPSYRDVGAMMVFWPDNTRFGHLSSGCIEDDLGQHAAIAHATGTSTVITYGIGSPYFDLQLPCGGGMDVLLIPSPDVQTLRLAQDHRNSRAACHLLIDIETGALAVSTDHAPNASFCLPILPKTSVVVVGQGAEAVAFSDLAASLGFVVQLASPDVAPPLTDRAITTHHLTVAGLPSGIVLDAWTAVVLFFHDHHWEPPIMQQALESNAFFVGAQGSKRTHDNRLLALADLGCKPADLARIRSPIGLIPSARDEKTLAISVLAHVVAVAKECGL